MTVSTSEPDRRGIPTKDSIRAGIFFSIAAVFVFSVSNALIKWLVARYPVGEVVVFRSIFSLIPALVIVFSQGGWGSLRTPRIICHDPKQGHEDRNKSYHSRLLNFTPPG